MWKEEEDAEEEEEREERRTTGLPLIHRRSHLTFFLSLFFFCAIIAEGELRGLDQKIGLLIHNRITVQEVIAQSQGLTRIQSAERGGTSSRRRLDGMLARVCVRAWARVSGWSCQGLP